MKIAKVYSHLNGLEWLRFHQESTWKEITAVVEGIDASKHKTKVSEESRKKGRMLYSPEALNSTFKDSLVALGWKPKTTRYIVTDEEELIRETLALSEADQRKAVKSEGKPPILSYNQTDFVRDEVAIEVQFGKYPFIDYDMFVKHMAFYARGEIKVGIEIVAMKSMQTHMSSGPGYYERALYDIVRQGRGIPTVPLVLIGIEPSDSEVSLDVEALIDEDNSLTEQDAAKMVPEEDEQAH